ncbi:MAG: 4Fe-4S binding protein [Candidatus Helarchaeota archaeon]
MKYRVLLLDASKCSGCGNCLMACPANELIIEGIDSPLAQIFSIKNGKCIIRRACQHCTDAPCLEKCPEGILIRDENNLVRLDLDYETLKSDNPEEILKKCNECKDKPCIEACPFHNLVIVPVTVKGTQFNIPIKCTQCLGDPQCVKACGTGALTYVDISIKDEAKQKLAALFLKGTELAKKASKSYNTA